MPSAAPLILGSAFRRETPALDSFLLQYWRVWSLMHILMFTGSIIQNTTKKKKNALNGRIPNGKTELNVNAEHKNSH